MDTINPDCGINALVIGVWNDAERKARAGDPAAREWLYSEGVLWIDIILNIHPDRTRAYLRRKLNRAKGSKAKNLTGSPTRDF